MTINGWLKKTFGGFVPAAASPSTSFGEEASTGYGVPIVTGTLPLSSSGKAIMAKADFDRKWQEREARKVLEKHMAPGKVQYNPHDMRWEEDDDNFTKWAMQEKRKADLRRELEKAAQRQHEVEMRAMYEMQRQAVDRQRQEETEAKYEVVTYFDKERGEYRQRKQHVEGERYTDADGRTFRTSLENKIKPVVHKTGHFPIEWMVEAATRAEESDALVHIEVDAKGVTVIAEQAGEDYASHHIVWTMMEKSEINPLIPAIENVERQLRVQSSLKKAANG